MRAPHSILRKAARAVTVGEIQGSSIQKLISDIEKILSQTPDGVGLAAPQVGVGLRVFIVSEEAATVGRREPPGRAAEGDGRDSREEKQWKYFVFINPVLKKKSRKKVEFTEGCLSVPGRYGIVPRAEKVSIEWHDGTGRKQTRGFTKFFARVIQHEMDHLDGVLITDRAKELFDATKAGNQQ